MSATTPAIDRDAPTPDAGHVRVPLRDRRLIAYPILALGVAVLVGTFWPGLLTPDSNQTLFQANSDFASDWWTAFGAIVLRWWLDLQLGVGSVYGIGLLLNVVGLYLCARAALPRVPAAVVAVLLLLFPPTAAQLTGLSRDIFYLGFSLCAFGCFARLPSAATAGRARALVAGGLAFAFLAFLCRQNAIVVLMALGGLATVQLARTERPKRARLLRIAGAGVAVAVAGLVVAKAFYTVGGVRSVHPERFAYVYDLASISTLTHENQFPEELVRRQRPGYVTQDVTQPFLEQHFDYPNVITLYPDGGAGKILFADEQIAAAEAPLLRDAWIEAVTSHPGDYLWGRIKLTGSQLGIVRRPTDAFIPLLEPSNFQHPLRHPAQYRDAYDVLIDFVGPMSKVPLDLPWVYTLLSLALCGVLWRMGAQQRGLALAMTFSIIGNLLVLGAVAMASAYRYTDLAVPLTGLMLVYVLAAGWNTRALKKRNAAPETTGTVSR